jgi:hypothetical protein
MSPTARQDDAQGEYGAMSGRRLNGWQRIGIVLSVVWAIGAGLQRTADDTERRSDGNFVKRRVS